jgi:enoyl-CoA hydratase
MGGAVNHQTLRVEREGAVAVVAVHRPERRNALNSAVRAELMDAVAALTGDHAVRVLVLTGSGDHAFIAGADIVELAQRSEPEQRAAMEAPGVFEAVAGCPKPVIAMINGYALGGGCELALACDVRIAADTARLGQPEINLALIPGGGGTQRLPRLVGQGQASRLILSGELIDAREALRIGLVDEVVPAAELRARTLELAGRMAQRSPRSLAAAKEAIRAAAEVPLTAGLARERQLFLACFASEDGREGVRAFLQKREPDFHGR